MFTPTTFPGLSPYPQYLPLQIAGLALSAGSLGASLFGGGGKDDTGPAHELRNFPGFMGQQKGIYEEAKARVKARFDTDQSLAEADRGMQDWFRSWGSIFLQGGGAKGAAAIQFVNSLKADWEATKVSMAAEAGQAGEQVLNSMNAETLQGLLSGNLTPEQQKMFSQLGGEVGIRNELIARETSKQSLARLRGELPSLSPEETAMIDRIFDAEQNKGIGDLKRLAIELAGQRGLRPTDSPIFNTIAREGINLKEQLQARKADVTLRQMLSRDVLNFDVSQRQSQIQNQALQNRLAMLQPLFQQAGLNIQAAGMTPQMPFGQTQPQGPSPLSTMTSKLSGGLLSKLGEKMTESLFAPKTPSINFNNPMFDVLGR